MVGSKRKKDKVRGILSLRDRLEERACFSCGKYKMKAQFYNWYSIVEQRLLGVICGKCAKRETGSKHIERLKEANSF